MEITHNDSFYKRGSEKIQHNLVNVPMEESFVLTNR